jgi:carbon monoxide dehydrogenase subunit G
MLGLRTNLCRTTIAVALAALLAPVAAAAVDFTPAELGILVKGGVVKHELPSSRKGGFYGGSGFAVVDAPIDAVWAAIQDWDAYARAFPNTTESVELSRKGGRSLIRMKIGHPLVSVQYHVEMSRDEAKKVLSFRLVPGMPNDLDDVRGYWRLFPQPGGRTLIAYVLAIRAPMGLVSLVGPKLEGQAMDALLRVPGFMKAWVEGPGRARYR